MKLKLVLFATTALIVAVTLTVYSQVGLEEKAKAAQAKPIIIKCPDNIQVGPVYVPDGWQSLGSLPKARLQIKVDAEEQTIVCEYGNANALFQTYFISKKIPEGYDCKIPYPKDYQAVCNRRTRNRP